MKKTDLDISREEKVYKINHELLGTGLEVIAGGRTGPYSILIKYLCEEDMRKLLKKVKRLNESI